MTYPQQQYQWPDGAQPAPQQPGGWGQQPPAAPWPAQPQPGGWGQPPQQPAGWGGQPVPQQQYAPAPPAPPQRPAGPPPSADELMSGSARAAKFPDRAYGTVIGGRIVEKPKVVQQRDHQTKQPKFYADGNAAWQTVVIVDTGQRDPADPGDDGMRAFYVKNQMRKAVMSALRTAGVDGLEVGGELYVRYERDEPNQNGSGYDKKIYAARYTPPAGRPVAAPPPPAAPAPPPPAGPPPGSPQFAGAAPMTAQDFGVPAGQQQAGPPPDPWGRDEPPF